MQEMDFYELPRAVQDRFTISVRGEGQPRPLLVIRPGVSRAVLAWSATGAVAATILAGLVGIGLGNLKSHLAIHPLSFVGGYALLTATIGIVLAPGIWFLRNSGSDRQMLAHASKTRDAKSYREYLARGGRNGEVREVLLPRAELSEAAKDGTVEAIEKFIATHPNSHIQGEVSGALRQAMLGELEAAKKAGTVSALTDFAKLHPNNLVDVELRQAIHGVYQAALA